MSEWSNFAKNLAALDETLSDAVRTLYGPHRGLAGHPAFDTTPPDEKKDEGYWQSILTEEPR
jgi:hypothetical protein